MNASATKTHAADTAGDARWFVVQIQPSREPVAILNLERQGFEVFAPRVLRTRLSRTRKRTERLEPLFPGYLFVRLDLDRAQWRSVNGTYGVSRLVTFGERPATLTIGFVEALADRANEQAVVAFAENLRAGDRVRVISGPFDDLIGTLESERGPERVVVMMQLLSGTTPVELEAKSLIRA